MPPGDDPAPLARWLRVEGPEFHAEPVWAGEPVKRELVEYRVPEDSLIVGRQLAQAGRPSGADVVLLHRYDTYVLVRGSTRLRRADVALVLADEASLHKLDLKGELVRQPRPSACEVPDARPDEA